MALYVAMLLYPLRYGVWVTGNISPLCSYTPDPFMFLGTKEKTMEAGHVTLSEWQDKPEERLKRSNLT